MVTVGYEWLQVVIAGYWWLCGGYGVDMSGYEFSRVVMSGYGWLWGGNW